jgi:hypothetical protein
MKKRTTYGFGFDPVQSVNHFYVIVDAASAPSVIANASSSVIASAAKQSRTPPVKTSGIVQVYERYSWTEGDEQILTGVDVLRIEISKHKWGEVKAALTYEFNSRLKETGLKISKFPMTGSVPVERLFGKEMMVLLWAIEDCDPSAISTAVRNWKGLMPEERWWLYTMTNAATGELKDRRGWRKALMYALCENPVVERRQLSMFDDL